MDDRHGCESENVISGLAVDEDGYGAGMGLTESRAKCRALFQAMADAVLIVERETGRILEANPAAARVYRLPVQGLMEMTIFELSQEPDKTAAFLAGGLSGPDMERHRALDGTGLTVEIRASGLTLGGRETAVLSVRDATAEIEGREALKRSRERLALALEATSDGMWDWNIKTGELYMSPGYFTMLGHEPGSLPPSFETWVQLLHPGDKTFVVKKIQEHMRTRSKGFEVEFRLRRAGGDYLWVLGRGKVVELDEMGQGLRMVGTHSDISRRKAAEAALKRSERKFRRLYESSRDGFAAMDGEGRFIEYNSAFLNMLGYEDQELLARSFWDLFAGGWEEGLRNGVLEQASARGYSDLTERECLKRDGSLVTLEFQVYVGAGSREGREEFWVYVRDITRRKRDLEYMKALAQFPDGSPNPILRVGLDGFLQYANRASAELVRDMRSSVGEPVPPAIRRNLSEPQTRLPGHSFEASIAGRVWLFTVSAFPEMEAVYLFGQDVTDRELVEREREMVSRVFENSIEGIVVADGDGVVRMVNPAFTEITGFEPDEVMGRYMDVFPSGEMDASVYKELWEGLTTRGQWSGELWNRRKSGEAYPEWLTLSVIKNETGRVMNYVAMFHDITELKRTQERMHYQAHHDALTGLPNRLLLGDRLTQALNHGRRVGKLVAVIFLDLDSFKEINDTLGHPVGDQVLKQVGRRLSDSLRGEDTVARIGGDEFVVVLNEIPTSHAAAMVARKILSVLTMPMTVGEHKLTIHASLGVALFPQDGEDAETLVKHADLAMYRAKEAGKNQYKLFTASENKATARRIRMEARLRRAIEQDKFSPYYQPWLAAADGSVNGLEVNVHWSMTDRPPVPARKFLHLIEESDLVTPLGKTILQRACGDAASWLRGGGEWKGETCLVFDVSLKRFKSEPFLDTLRESLASSGIPGSILGFVFIDGMNWVTPRDENVLKVLNDMGIRLYAGKFGLGGTLPHQLSALPLSGVVAPPPLAGYAGGPKEPLLRGLVAMAKHLGLKVVLRGVQSHEERKLFYTMGCDCVQGPLGGKPVSGLEIDRILRETPSCLSPGKA